VDGKGQRSCRLRRMETFGIRNKYRKNGQNGKLQKLKR
jgi:hypothetical protein